MAQNFWSESRIPIPFGFIIFIYTQIPSEERFAFTSSSLSYGLMNKTCITKSLLSLKKHLKMWKYFLVIITCKGLAGEKDSLDQSKQVSILPCYTMSNFLSSITVGHAHKKKKHMTIWNKYLMINITVNLVQIWMLLLGLQGWYTHDCILLESRRKNFRRWNFLKYV